MLSKEDKIKIFEQILLKRYDSYGDMMKDEVYFYYFELENDTEFKFLDFLNTQEEINNKIDFVVSKMIRHEHQEGLWDIIQNYLD